MDNQNLQNRAKVEKKFIIEKKNNSYNRQYSFLQQNFQKRLISQKSILQLKNPFLQHFLQQSLDLLCHTKDIPDHANSVCNWFICLSDLLYHPVTLIKNGEGGLSLEPQWPHVNLIEPVNCWKWDFPNNIPNNRQNVN